MELYNNLEKRLEQHINTISLKYQGPQYELYNPQRNPKTLPELVLKDATFNFRYEGQMRAFVSHCNTIGFLPTADSRVTCDRLNNHTLESLVSALELASHGYTYTTNDCLGNSPMLVTTRLTFYSVVTYDDFVTRYNQNITIGKVYTLQGQGFIYRNMAWDVVIIVKDYFDTLKVPFFDTGKLAHRQTDQPEMFIPHGNGYGMAVIDTESKVCVGDVHLYDVCPIRIVAVGQPEDVTNATEALDKVLSKFPSKVDEIYPTIELLIGDYDVQFALQERRDCDLMLHQITTSTFSVYVELLTSVHINNTPRHELSLMPTIVTRDCVYICKSETDKDKVIRYLLDNGIIESREILGMVSVNELIDALLLRATLVGLKS